MPDEKKKTTPLEWAKFGVGSIAFGVLAYAQFWRGTEVNLIWVLLVGLLMGLDPAKIISGITKK